MKIYTDTPWLKTQYLEQDTQTMLGMLKSLVEPNEKTAVEMFNGIANIILKSSSDYSKVETASIAENLGNFNEYKTHDFLCLAIILCLSEIDHHVERTQRLLSAWDNKLFNIDERIKLILEALANKDYDYIKRQNILGEGYQNQAARENGIKDLEWFNYKKQMKSMTKGLEIPELKDKFSFMNTLPENTLGGELTALLRSNKLSLPGEKFGFTEFFLWHDISHLLSGNNQDFPGELGANAFTAAFSRRGKFKILLFGLLQWNIGMSLAIVAKPSKDQFKLDGTIELYLKSILSGCHTIFDLLEWPVEDMIQDLKLDINRVRRKYNITPIQGNL